MSDQRMIRGSAFTNGKKPNRRTSMIVWSTVLIGALIALAPVLATSQATPEWVLKADYVDACSCDLACPCLFGGSPTHGYCKGASLVEIKEGHYGQVDFKNNPAHIKVTIMIPIMGSNLLLTIGLNKFIFSSHTLKFRILTLFSQPGNTVPI